MKKDINRNDVCNSLDQVLGFSKNLMILGLRGQQPEESEVNLIRHHCDLLTKEGVFEFDLNCDNFTLFQQIQRFANCRD